MKKMKKNLEDIFESFANYVCRNKMWIIILTLVTAAGMIYQVPNLKFNGSIEGFLKVGDPDLQAYNEFRHQFGEDGQVIIAIHSPNIFSLHFLKKLKALHEDLEKEVPFMEEITSMVNARNVRGSEGVFIVENLLAEWPQDEKALDALKQRVLSNQIYENLLISKDSYFTTITIKPDRYSQRNKKHDIFDQFIKKDDVQKILKNKDKSFLHPVEISQLVKAVNRVVKRHNDSDFKIYCAGSPIVSDNIISMVRKDMPTFTRVCLLLICILLFLLMRRLSLVFLSMLIVGLSLFSTFGLMAFLDRAIKPPTQILLSIIIVAGICDSVHILSVFYRRFDKTGEKEASIIYAVKHCGIPCLFTSLTTSAGLLSFVSSELSPICDLGIFGAIGVTLAMLYTLLLLPPILSLAPIKRRKPKGDTDSITFLDRIIQYLGSFANRHPVKVLMGAAPLILMICIMGLGHLRFYHNSLKWLPEDSKIRKDTEKIDKKLKGSINLEVIMDTKTNYGLHNYQILTRLNEATGEIKKLENDEITIGKSIVVSDVLREINQALNDNNPEFYKVPDGLLINQEFLLFENSGSDDLEDFVDSMYRKARFSIRVPWLEAGIYSKFIDRVQKLFNRKFDNKTSFKTTGKMAILAKTSSAVMRSLADSYILCILAVSMLMILVLKSFKLGLLSMIPNILPVFFILGIMGIFRMPFDTFSMLIGAIVLGLIVDDTIHFFHNYKKYYQETNDTDKTIKLTLLRVGRPLLITSIILIIGFSSYTLSSLSNVQDFGIIMGFTVLVALLFDLMITPAILTLIYRAKSIAWAGKKCLETN